MQMSLKINMMVMIIMVMIYWPSMIMMMMIPNHHYLPLDVPVWLLFSMHKQMQQLLM